MATSVPGSCGSDALTPEMTSVQERDKVSKEKQEETDRGAYTKETSEISVAGETAQTLDIKQSNESTQKMPNLHSKDNAECIAQAMAKEKANDSPCKDIPTAQACIPPSTQSRESIGCAQIQDITQERVVFKQLAVAESIEEGVNEDHRDVSEQLQPDATRDVHVVEESSTYARITEDLKPFEHEQGWELDSGTKERRNEEVVEMVDTFEVSNVVSTKSGNSSSEEETENVAAEDTEEGASISIDEGKQDGEFSDEHATNEHEAGASFQDAMKGKKGNDAMTSNGPDNYEGTSQEEELSFKETNAILVDGLDQQIDKEMLELFFENRKRSGGGEIEKIHKDQGSGQAIIWFIDPSVARRVLEKMSTVTLGGCLLSIHPWVRRLAVKVLGIKDIPQDVLELFFESASKSRGGEVGSIDIQHEAQTTIINFCDEKVARRVIAKHSFSLCGCELTAEPYYGFRSFSEGASNQIPYPVGSELTSYSQSVEIQDDIIEDPVEQTCAIEVSGVSEKTSCETVKMYFENRIKSGGGRIEEIWHNQENGNYIITFVSRDSVEEVLSRSRHILDHSLLQVKEFRSGCCAIENRAGLVETDKVYIHGLNADISRDQLKLYLENINCEVMEVEYGLDPTVAMVTVSQQTDFSAVRKALCRKPLQGHMLSVCKVPRSNHLQVYNIGAFTADTLSAYFEAKRSGGSGEVDIVIHDEEKCAVVTFDNYEIAENVLRRDQHMYDGRELHVRIYREELGLLPEDHDPSQPCAQKQVETSIQGLDPVKAQFLKSIPKVLMRLNARIDWEHNLETELRVLSTLKSRGQEAHREWENNVRDSITYLLSQVQVKRIECVQHVWNNMSRELQWLTERNPTVVFVEKPSECTLCIVGRSETVKLVNIQVKNLCQEIEQRLQYIMYSLKLTENELNLLRKVRAAEELRKTYPEVKITDTESDFEVYGAPTDLLAIQADVHSFLKRTSATVVNLSKGQFKVLVALLKQQQGLFNRAMKNLRIVLSLEDDNHLTFKKDRVVIKGDKVVVFGKDTDVNQCAELLLGSITEKTLTVSMEEHSAFNGSNWQEFSSVLVMRCSGALHIVFSRKNSAVEVAAFTPDVDNILEQVKGFIRQNALKRVSIDLTVAQVRMITQWMKEDLLKAQRHLDRYGIQITFPDSGGLLIIGVEDGLGPAKTRVRRLVSKMVTSTYSVTTPGMPQYFTQDTGRYFIQSLENKHQVIIQPEAPENTDSPAVGAVSQCSTTKMKELLDVTHATGVKVKVVIGDVTSHEVDVIVNAANGHLSHNGGLAKAIVDKGGQSIQEESDRYVEQNGPVMVGHAALTGSGNLPCKHILHAVGPQWKGGSSGEADILYDCVFSYIMRTVWKESWASVAIPAISAGVFGVPLHVSTSTIVEAVKNFLDTMPDKGSPTEVHLIDNREDVTQAFVDAVNKYFSSSAVSTITSKSFLWPKNKEGEDNNGAKANDDCTRFSVDTPKLGHKVAVDKVREHKKEAAADISADRVQWSFFGKPMFVFNASYNKKVDTFSTKEGLTVTLKSGSITHERVDMIVNSVSRDLNLSHGAVSRALLEAAGPSVQDEVNAKHMGDLAEGEHVTTTGGKLSCLKIFHAVLCPWLNDDNQRTIQTLQKVVHESLEHSSKNGFVSLALPALGTGGLKFPREIVAETMFNSVLQFSQKNPNSTVKDVRFVLYDKDQSTIHAFEDHLKIIRTSPGLEPLKERKVHKVTSPLIQSIKQQTSPFDVSGRTESTQPSSSEGAQIVVGSIRLVVVPGDICRQTTEAIINPTNSRLDFSTRDIGENGIITTGGGALQVKRILHLDVERIRNTEDVKLNVASCLALVQKEKLSSVSFPHLGMNGVLRGSPGDVATAFMDAVGKFAKNDFFAPQTTVTVALDNRLLVPIYCERMKKATEQGGSLYGLSLGSIKFFDRKNSAETTSCSKPAGTSKKESCAAAVKRTSVLSFTILGLDKESIDAVKKEMKACCERESADVYISGSVYSDVIKQLDKAQTKEIEEKCGKVSVKMTVDLGERNARIRLQGQTKTVYQVESHVKEILHKIKSQLAEREQDELLSQLVLWEYKDSGVQYHPYPAEINTRLEKAHNAGDHFIEWMEDEADGIVKWKVDLNAKTETDGTTTKEIRRIIISDKGSTLDVPADWTKGTGPVELRPTDPEYQHICQEFNKTSSRTIKKIERLQNKYLYRRYAVHKEDMEGRNLSVQPFERRLWHGTSPDSINSINTNGFNRSYCGQHGVVYGQGVYFATTSQYASNYSRPPDSNGHRKMYYARVLTGEFTIGNQLMKTPPTKNDPSNPSVHYDSTVDRTHDPSIYVIYYDTQAYPEYIVTFV